MSQLSSKQILQSSGCEGPCCESAESRKPQVSCIKHFPCIDAVSANFGKVGEAQHQKTCRPASVGSIKFLLMFKMPMRRVDVAQAAYCNAPAELCLSSFRQFFLPWFVVVVRYSG